MALRVHYGVDPGKMGAWSIFIDGELNRVVRLPIITTAAKRTKTGKIIAKSKFELDMSAFIQSLRLSVILYEGAAFSATIERVGENAMPQREGQEVSGGLMSMAKLAGMAGEIRGILATLGIPFECVQPAVWKRHFGLGKDKDDSRLLAQKLWPWLDLKYKNQTDLAEAALVGAYGLLKSGDFDGVR